MPIMAVNLDAWFLLLLTLINQFLCSSLAATAPSDLPFAFLTTDGKKATSRTYDYIVVGGGTAGCPLAATLSAHYSVLVVERGGSPYGNPDIENADAFGKILGETNNYTSPAQTFISEDGVALHRARVLGGGTSLNGGFYDRAGTEYVRKMQWDERLVNESYEWVEKQNVFKPDHITSFSSAFKDALLEVGVLPDNGYTLDHMDGTKISGATFDNKGKRHTAADLLKTANPNNIAVLLNATVSRILFNSSTSQGKKGTPRARGVEFVDVHGQSYQAFIDESSPYSEVIVSAGAIGSPQLLLLSGIGPSEHLKKFNIPLVLHLPSVGQGVQDNPRATVVLQFPTPVEINALQVVGILNASQTYLYAASFIQQLRSVNGSTSPQSVYAGRIFEKVAFPLSRGELWLRTKDPRDNPSVRYNYYSHPQDLTRCVEGVRVIAKLLETKALQKFKYATADNSLHEFHFIGQTLPNNTRDDAAVVQFCRDTLETVWHYHGGCNVGSVINQRYEVKGVESLRIVDISTFPDALGTNTQATTLMLGRYVGIKILQERKE